MKNYHLKNVQSSRLGGFTDLWIIKQTAASSGDLTQTTNNTQQAITLSALAIGDIVLMDLFMEVRTVGAGLATFTASVGVTGALTQFIAAQDMLAGNVYFAQASSVAPYATIAASKNLVVNFTPGASEALASATALELWIWAKISRLSDRNTIQV